MSYMRCVWRDDMKLCQGATCLIFVVVWDECVLKFILI